VEWGLGFENLLVGGFRKEDGFSLTTGGDDEFGKVGWLRAEGRMKK